MVDLTNTTDRQTGGLILGNIYNYDYDKSGWIWIDSDKN